MPAGQLKRLKASLRESGITGPQKSKKQKQRDYKDGRSKDRAISKAAALGNIREAFNPFEVKTSSRGPKRDIASAAKPKSSVLGRPGIAKSAGEKLRREKLLGELARRNKVGGIVDRRFGENDPTLTPEERAHERFVREKQRGGRKAGLFDLEGDDDLDGGDGLTHLGNSLSFSSDLKDDYEGSEDNTSDDGDVKDQATRRAAKRQKLLEQVAEMGESGQLDENSGHPKTKHEIMKEVIAKSKLYKYERQKTKEDDDDLRLELDANLKDVFALMKGQPTSVDKPRDVINPDRAALILGKTREEADKEYDRELRAMTLEARSKPTTRTKTDEEIAEEEAQRLKELEEGRLRRMRGESEDSGSEEEQQNGGDGDDEFGLGAGILRQNFRSDLDVEDEDDFDLDQDLIASGSEVDASSSDDEDGSDSDLEDDDNNDAADDEEDEFIKDILTAEDAGRTDLEAQTSVHSSANDSKRIDDISYTLPCPSSHKEFLEISKGIDSMELITIIQRIRALHSPKLDGKNKAKLAAFAAILVDHLVYLTNKQTPAHFAVLEQIIRHIHSLAKNYPVEVANAFRKHLEEIGNERSLDVNAGDLILMVAIGEIFSTSDHFHQVVTPAMLCMAWYLGQSIPTTLGDLAKGAFLCMQFLQYQRLSKRYIPEVVTYSLMALEALAAVAPRQNFGLTPKRSLDADFRISSQTEGSPKMSFWDINFSSSLKSAEAAALKQSLVRNFTSVVSYMSELWVSKSAFIEMMSPLSQALRHLLSKPSLALLSPSLAQDVRSAQTKLERLLAQAAATRTPLALHHHRPLPIKMSVPKFEDKFNPERKSSHDPDRDRAASAKLRAEYKKERKGALRELRKDANFIARESLREKKAADVEYEKKYRRLVAEIQGEEGREANAYEREKKWRQGKK